MENLVRQLREQQAILTTYLRDQKNHHEDVIAKLEEKQQEIKKQMIAQHEDEKERLKKEQAEYVTLLQRHHKSINAMIENSYVERIKHLKNEYALLQAALRNYKQAVRSDIGMSKSFLALRLSVKCISKHFSRWAYIALCPVWCCKPPFQKYRDIC